MECIFSMIKMALKTKKWIPVHQSMTLDSIQWEWEKRRESRDWERKIFCRIYAKAWARFRHNLNTGWYERVNPKIQMTVLLKSMWNHCEITSKSIEKRNITACPLDKKFNVILKLGTGISQCDSARSSWTKITWNFLCSKKFLPLKIFFSNKWYSGKMKFLSTRIRIFWKLGCSELDKPSFFVNSALFRSYSAFGIWPRRLKRKVFRRLTFIKV